MLQQLLHHTIPHVTLMSRPSTSSPADTSIQPVTRSRTLFYLSIRDSITPTHNRGTIKTGQYGDTLDIADNEEEERLIEGNGRGKGLPPKWYAFCRNSMLKADAKGGYKRRSRGNPWQNQQQGLAVPFSIDKAKLIIQLLLLISYMQNTSYQDSQTVQPKSEK